MHDLEYLHGRTHGEHLPKENRQSILKWDERKGKRGTDRRAVME